MANKIILGTVQFGLDYGINNRHGKPNVEEVSKILSLAFKNNITLLDSAEAYGDSHEQIGIYHQSVKHRFGIITKFSSKRNDLSEDLSQRVLQNMQVLNVSYLYAYMYHSFSDFETYFQRHSHSIQHLKTDGLIKKFGVSIYTNEEFEKLLRYEGIDLIQLPFNLLDNNFQRARLISKAKEKGIEVHTRSAFLQGLFFKELNQFTDRLIRLKPHIERIKAIASSQNISLKDLALNYCVQQANIDYVLIGVDLAEQLSQNLESLSRSINASTLQQIDDIKVLETDLLNPSNWHS